MHMNRIFPSVCVISQSPANAHASLSLYNNAGKCASVFRKDRRKTKEKTSHKKNHLQNCYHKTIAPKQFISKKGAPEGVQRCEPHWRRPESPLVATIQNSKQRPSQAASPSSHETVQLHRRGIRGVPRGDRKAPWLQQTMSSRNGESQAFFVKPCLFLAMREEN